LMACFMKLSSRQTIFFFCLLLGTSAQVCADSSPISQLQSLSLSYQNADDLIQANNQIIETTLATVTLFHSYQWNQHWLLSSSLWQGRDSGASNKFKTFKHTDFKQDTKGASVSVMGFFDALSWETGVSFSQENAEVYLVQPRSMSSNIRKVDFTQDIHSWDFFTSSSYVLDWHLFSLTPSLGLGYQQSQRDTITDALIKNSPLREKAKTNLDSSYLMSGITLSYLVEGVGVFGNSAEILWQPSFSVSWTESLSGGSKRQSNIELHNARGKQLKTSQQIGRNEVNSGAYSTSLLMLVGDYYVECSYANTFNTDFSGQSFSVLFGKDF